MWIGRRVGTGTELRKEKEDDTGQGELYQHVQASREQREVEVEMLRVKHPFVILQINESESAAV